MTVHEPVRIAISGAGGSVAYSLLFRIASGQMFGSETPVVLQMLDVDAALPILEGIAMELSDCAFPLLEGIAYTSDDAKAFDGANWALLLGAAPRTKGMERGDLLQQNASIFKPQGQMINQHAEDNVRVLVVGNPCNTNCMIARANAPDIPDDRWFAMTRLDENRAKSFLATRAGVGVEEVTNLAIWGNHSATQFPDFQNARIGGQPVDEVIEDEAWLQGEFLTQMQQRGAAILHARGASSAASAASAVIDSVRSIVDPSQLGDITSLAVVSNGEYGVPEGLQFGFPVAINEDGTWNVATGFLHDEFAKQKLKETTEELLAERDAVRSLL